MATAIKTYLTYDEYEGLHLSTLTKQDFDQSITKATLHFDKLTQYKFRNRGIEDETEITQSYLKLALGVLVEDIHFKTKMRNFAGELKSLTVAGSSQTLFTPSEVGVDRFEDYPQEVLDILRSLNLLRWSRVSSVRVL